LSAKIASEIIKYTNPSWEVIYNKERKIRPFIDEIIGVRLSTLQCQKLMI